MKVNDWIGVTGCVLLLLVGVAALTQPTKTTNRGYIEALKLGLARYDTDDQGLSRLYWVVPEKNVGTFRLIPAEGRP